MKSNVVDTKLFVCLFGTRSTLTPQRISVLQTATTLAGLLLYVAAVTSTAAAATVATMQNIWAVSAAAGYHPFCFFAPFICPTIQITDICNLDASQVNEEVVLHVHTTFDYHLRIHSKLQFLHFLGEFWTQQIMKVSGSRQCGKADDVLPVEFHALGTLQEFVVGKVASKNHGTYKKARRKR